jgi:polyphosphate kinase
MAKKKDNDAEAHASLAAARQATEAGRAPDGQPPKMKRKEYEREMRLLHGELVAMQEWVKASGAKICIRDRSWSSLKLLFPVIASFNSLCRSPASM